MLTSNELVLVTDTRIPLRDLSLDMGKATRMP